MKGKISIEAHCICCIGTKTDVPAHYSLDSVLQKGRDDFKSFLKGLEDYSLDSLPWTINDVGCPK